VPEALRGQGIAGRLVQAVVERAAQSGETVVPWCPYIRKWLRDHPDAADRLHIDWSDPPARAPD
jgi:predicted GNAT family acetyltransferase